MLQMMRSSTTSTVNWGQAAGISSTSSGADTSPDALSASSQRKRTVFPVAPLPRMGEQVSDGHAVLVASGPRAVATVIGVDEPLAESRDD